MRACRSYTSHDHPNYVGPTSEIRLSDPIPIPPNERGFMADPTHSQPAGDAEERNEIKTIAIDKTAATTHSEGKGPYSVFTVREKWMIVSMGALAGFVSPVAANLYFPAIPVIASAFHKSTELINLTVTVNMIFQGASPLVFGPLGDQSGRRPMLLLCLLTLSASCIGLALIPTNAYWALMLLRCFQAAGSASTIALGAGIVGDISTRAERGGFMALFNLGPMVGPSFGPVVGGALAQHLGWRSIFWFLLIASAVCFVVLLLFLPETLRALVGNGSIRPPRLNTPLIPIIGRSTSRATDLRRPQNRRGFQNPFALLLSLDIAVLLLLNSITFAILYSVIASISILFKTAYPFLDETEIGLCFLAMGGGMLTAAMVNGHLLDRQYRVIKDKMIRNLETVEVGRGEMLRPEDVTKDEHFPIEHARLRMVPVSLIVLNACTIGYGWSLEKRVSLALPLVLHVLMGYSILTVMNTTQTLLVDLVPDRSSAITACNNFTRCSLGAVVTSIIDIIINGIGVGWTYTLLGCIGMLCIPLIWVLIHVGPKCRARRRERKTES